MTDKVQKIREEIERLKLCTMDEHMKFYSESAEAEYYALCKAEKIIDSLQEEPVSEESEKASIIHSEIVRNASFIDEDFIAGAKWKEQQLMAKAIEAHCFGFQGAALFSFKLPAGSYLVGSKVKVIVIKED